MHLVKVIRFDPFGFTCHSPAWDCKEGRNPVFLNRTIHNIFQTDQSIDPSEMFFPREKGEDWKGCYCHLEEASPEASELAFRHIGFLPRNQVIWVKNRSHLEDGRPYFSQSIHHLEEGDAGETWVKMSVDDALERKRRWKENHADIPQWITECYLMDEQVKKLVFPAGKERVMEFWLSKT